MATLEERVAAIEERLGMESGLRASMDSDLSALNMKMSAMNHLIQAVAITQGEHATELARVTERLDLLNGQAQEQAAVLGQIIGMLDTLIGREDGPREASAE